MRRARESPLTGLLYGGIKNEPLTYNTSIGNQMQKESEWEVLTSTERGYTREAKSIENNSFSLAEFKIQQKFCLGKFA